MTRSTLIPSEATVQPLVAPFRLTSDHRLEFRRAVLESLEAAAASGDARLAIDLARTIEIQPSGLGVLGLLQKRARARGERTRLRHQPRARKYSDAALCR